MCLLSNTTLETDNKVVVALKKSKVLTFISNPSIWLSLVKLGLVVHEQFIKQMFQTPATHEHKININVFILLANKHMYFPKMLKLTILIWYIHVHYPTYSVAGLFYSMSETTTTKLHKSCIKKSRKFTEELLSLSTWYWRLQVLYIELYFEILINNLLSYSITVYFYLFI